MSELGNNPIVFLLILLPGSALLCIKGVQFIQALTLHQVCILFDELCSVLQFFQHVLPRL